MAKTSEELLGKVADRLDVAVEAISGLEKRLKSASALDSLHGSKDRSSFSFFSGNSVDMLATVNKSARFRQLRRAEELAAVEYKGRFKSATDFFSMMAKDPGEWRKLYNESVDSLGPRAKAIGMSTLNAESAGALVLPEISPAILEHTYSNDLWNRCDTYTVSGNTMLFPASGRSSRKDGKRGGGIQGYWRGEGNEATKSRGKFESVRLTLHDLCVAVFVTQELLDDNSYALEQWISRKVAEELNFQRGYALIRGNGDGKPLGILNAPGTIAVPQVASQGKTIVTQNILDMWSRRVGSDDSAAGNLVWMMNQDCEPYINKLSLAVGSAGGQLTYMPPGGLSGSPYATLMGRPVLPTEFCSTVGDVGDIILADWSQYLGIEKGGIIEETSAHVEFLRREMCFLFTIRIDGRPADEAPIEQLFGTNTQSPFVTLATRASE